MTSQGTSTPTSRAAIGRRSVVKAGAWSVPLVSAVAVSPAYAACSPTRQPNLTFAPFSASYNNGSSSTLARPDLLDVAFTIKNTGAQATTGLTVTLSIPANLHDVAPTSPANPTGWTATGSWTGSLSTGWTRTYTAVSQLPATTGTLNFSTQVTFNDTASPFRAWGGNAFQLGATANVTNPCHLGGTGAASVPESVKTSLTIAASGNFASRATNGVTRGTLSISGVQPVTNAGRRTSGVITLTVTIPKLATGGAFNTSVPTGAPTGVAAGWTYLAGPTGSGPWTYTFTYATRAPGGIVGVNSDSQTGTFACNITLTPEPANSDANQVTVSISANAPNAAAPSNTITDSSTP